MTLTAGTAQAILSPVIPTFASAAESSLHRGFGYDLGSSIPLGLENNPNCQKATTISLSQQLKNSDIVSSYSSPEAVPLIETLQPLFRTVMKDLATLDHAFHNVAHTKNVQLILNLLHKWTNLLELGEEKLPAKTIAALILERRDLANTSVVLHDYDHCGIRYRQRMPNFMGRVGNISNEEWSTISGDALLSNHYSPRQRLIIQGAILGTSHAQDDVMLEKERDRRILVRDYKPTTRLEKLVSFADKAAFILGTEIHLEGSLNFLREVGQKPASFEAWLDTERKFVTYLRATFDQFTKDGLFNDSGVKEIGLRLSQLEKRGLTLDKDLGFRARYDEIISKMR